MNSKSNGQPRFFYLDSMRGIAALSVMLGHFTAAYTPSFFSTWAWRSPLSLFSDGLAAVSLFFVLSGFVLSYRHFQGKQNSGPFGRGMGSFYLSRFFRIYPAFWTSLILAFVVCQCFQFYQWYFPFSQGYILDSWRHSFSISDLFSQSTLYLDLQSNNHLFPPDWTLIAEVKASILMPFLILVGKETIVGLTILLAFVPPYYFVSFFFLGIILAKYYEPIRATFSAASVASRLSIFAIAIVLYTVRALQPIFLPQMSKFLTQDRGLESAAIASFLFIALAISSITAQNVLQNKVFLYLGKISYSFYLLHFLIIKALSPLLILWIQDNISQSPLVVGSVAGVGSVVANLILASLNYWWIELPSIKLGHWLANKVFEKRLDELADGSAGIDVAREVGHSFILR